ncbi:MAG: OsmC family peroxiredoxin [Gemmatimonadales bacterium]|nr:MAG: OsmC family peroxiredoxin [Gemmatimonadales bacterium]
MDLITVSRRAGLAFEVRLRGHVLTTDMSPAEGGRDEGPNPVELLACSVGSCLATMVQAYCDARGYHDGDVGASLTFELAAAPKRIAAVVVDLELPRGMPEEARAKLQRLLADFPVPATLRTAPRLDIEIT